MTTDSEENSENSANLNPPDKRLKTKVISSVKWQVAGQVASQSIRVGTNLILTRLLLPEAFGLMGMVQAVVMSLELLSDVGLRGSVIHHDRGDDPDFLNTVWTAQVARGWILWLLTCLGAYPFSIIYEMPELLWLLPLTGLNTVFRGFSSTSLLLAHRHLQPKWIITVEVAATIVGNTIMIIVALLTRSVVALGVGWVATQVVHAWLSYQRHDIPRNKFHWDKAAAKSIVDFGRLSLISSAIMILLNRGDRFALGKMMPVAQLGIFMIGANIALMPMVMFGQINASVLQPTYSKLRSMSSGEAKSKIRKLRLVIVLGFVPLLTLFIVFGQWIIELMYPPNLHGAGWYCSVVGLAALMRVGCDPGPIFPARGDAKTHLHIIIVRAIAQVVALYGGYTIGLAFGNAVNGLLFGVVFAPLLAYPYEAWQYRRVNAWIPEADVIAIAQVFLLCYWISTW